MCRLSPGQDANANADADEGEGEDDRVSGDGMEGMLGTAPRVL